MLSLRLSSIAAIIVRKRAVKTILFLPRHFLSHVNGRPDIDCSFKRVVFLSYRISWIAAETEHIAKEKTI